MLFFQWCSQDNDGSGDGGVSFVSFNQNAVNVVFLGSIDKRPVVITIATLNLTADIGTKIVLRCAANGTPPVSMK